MAYRGPVTVAPEGAEQVLSPDFLKSVPKELPKVVTNARTGRKEVDPSLDPRIRAIAPPASTGTGRQAFRPPGLDGWEIPLEIPGTPATDARGNPFPKYVAKYSSEGDFLEITTADKYFVTSGQGDKDTYIIPKIDLSGRLISMGSGTPEQAKKSIFRVLTDTALEAAPYYLAALTGANLLGGGGLFGGAAGGAGAAGTAATTGNAGALINAGMGGQAAQAASAAANLATTTAGLNAAVAAGGGLVPSTAGFMSPDLISTAGGATPATSTLGVTTAGVPTTAPATGTPTTEMPTTTSSDYGFTTPPDEFMGPVAATETGVLDSLLTKASELTGLDKATLGKLGSAAVQTLISGYAAKTTADTQKQAAQTAADAQIEAARIAAEAARFRPVGVTTRFGSSNFGFDAQGNVISAGYTPSAEITGYQERLKTLAGQGMTDIEGARAAYQPLTGAAQNLFSLGNQYLAKSPEQAAQEYIAKQQALISPSRQNQLAELQNKLFQQGRGGAATAQGGSLMATSPEYAAYYNALAQQDLVLAAQADEEARRRIAFGSGLFDTGANLQGRYYTGQTAAYAPFATAMDTSVGLENLAQQPMTLGTQIGAKTTASSAEAGRLLSSGITGAAATMLPSNAYSLTGDVLGGISQSPQVASAIDRAFGVQPQQTAFNDQQVELLKRIFGT